MLRRLLFVDDEAMVLSGLRRALHGMRQEWNMEFVESGAAALQALDQERYDAIISDMRMPVMDGAQLLEQVKQRHPDVVRVVLSGQSSREAIFRSIAPAHQFLSKPCDPQELVTRLGQAFAMRDLLSNESLKTVVSGLRSIPSLPRLYEELTTVLQREDPSLGQIERIIAKDVGMAAKILQLANSAFIGSRGRVSSLIQALSLSNRLCYCSPSTHRIADRDDVGELGLAGPRRGGVEQEQGAGASDRVAGQGRQQGGEPGGAVGLASEREVDHEVEQVLNGPPSVLECRGVGDRREDGGRFVEQLGRRVPAGFLQDGAVGAEYGRLDHGLQRPDPWPLAEGVDRLGRPGRRDGGDHLLLDPLLPRGILGHEHHQDRLR